MNRLMNNLTVNDNEEIVYKEVELIKPLGRAVENIIHTPEVCNEHFIWGCHVFLLFQQTFPC